jgi:2-hydroxycyclohexanecarboxyl-CoA dehydrogenase
VTLAQTTQEIVSFHGQVKWAAGDATQTELGKQVVEQALEPSGRIDILFNYVGGMPSGIPSVPFVQAGEKIWQAYLNLNLITTLRFTQAVLGSMIKNQAGKIINTGSGAAREGAAGLVLYSAAKGGVIGFTKSLAKEVARHHISVNCICPGPIATLSLLKSVEGHPAALQAYQSGILLGRLGKPEEVAATVLFLASEEAAFITGQAISLDSGQVMY